MSKSVDQAFIKEYDANVHLAYQRQGSKLRKTVRQKNNVTGYSTTFQKAGKGAASTKSRHGKVKPMNINHEPVDCLLEDYYAGDYIDKFDELKMNIDERKVVENSGAYALGRTTDELIIEKLNTSTNIALDGSTGMTKPKILLAYEMLGDADCPDDGDRTCVVGWRQWAQLLEIEEFKNADYVGEDQLPWKGIEAKRWLGTLWMPHSGLTKTGNVRKCHWYHKTAVGHASGADVSTDVDWVGERVAHWVNSMMSQGSCLIDIEGVVTMDCLES